MNKTKSIYLALLAILMSPMAANADVILDRTSLDSLLGGNQTLEDFEGLTAAGQQRLTSGLDCGTTIGAEGPGLVDCGASYESESLFWNDDGYFDLQSRTLGDSSAWRNWGNRYYLQFIC